MSDCTCVKCKQIAELKATIAELREAARYTVNAWAAGSMEGTDDGINALAELLEKNDD